MKKTDLNRSVRHLVLVTTILMLSACSDQLDDSVRSQYKEIGWDELKPEEEKRIDPDSDLESLEIINDWYAGDSYSSIPNASSGYYGAPVQAYSVGVVEDFDGQKVRIPGFIVPIEFEAGKLVTEFFLVPYFGACFHKPPPPPNQIVYVVSKSPIRYESLYEPIWVMGTLKTEQKGNEIATSAYSMAFDVHEPYVE